LSALSVDLQGGSCGDWRRQGYPHLSSGRPNRAIRRSDAHHEAVACGGLHQISAGRARTHASTTNRECFGNRHSAGCPERSGPGEIDRTGRIGGGAFGNRASSLESTSISGIPKRRGCAAIRGWCRSSSASIARAPARKSSRPPLGGKCPRRGGACTAAACRAVPATASRGAWQGSR
jgi:hypothetical protein